MTTRFITVIFCSFSLVLGGVRAEASRGRSGLIIFGPVSGAVTTTSFTVTYRLAKSDQVCRLCLSPRKDMTVKTFTKAMKTDAACGNTVKLEANDLRADTRYYFALEVGGKLLEGSRGQCRTFPASFKKISFAFGNSIDTKKLGKGRLKPDVKGGLSAASENDLAFFLCTGDLFYGDINKKDVDRFRRAYASSLSYKEAQSLFQKVPLVYVWDDHDYGHNNSGKDSPSKAESMRAYREIIPHYPLAKGKEAPIYQAFSLANVRFILTDLRSQRDSGNVVDHPDKTMNSSAHPRPMT